MSGFKVEFSILNLRATPGIYADAFANRPAAGYPGRVFIDTDNPSTGMYRDTGTVWVQIAETATSDVDTLQNVTDNGNTTTNSITVGAATTPAGTIDVRRATAALNNATDYGIVAISSPTIPNGAIFGVNNVNAIAGSEVLTFAGSATIGNNGLNSAGIFTNVLTSTGAGTVTVGQGSTLRSISGLQSVVYYNTAAATTFTHVAAIKTTQPINSGAAAASVTNNYGIIVADNTANSGTITYTNRWGIYQEGASDKNYFAANVLIKSTTDNGNALQVTGQANFTSNVGIGTTSPTSLLQVNGQFRQVYATPFVANPLNVDGYSGHIIVNSNGGSTGVNGNLSGIGMYTNSDYTAAAGLFASQESSSAASMVFYTGSSLASERMRITSGGDVGIGTTAPINSTGYRTLTLGGGSTNYGQITWNSSTNAIGYAYNDATNMNIGSDAALIFQTTSSATERMRITSGGELLINTTTDVGDFKLQVSGNAYVSGTIGINATSPDAASLLQMDSTTKGFLLPRMTDAQITAISNPPDGLMVYSTDQNHIAFWNAGAGVWKKVSNSNL